MAVALAVAGLGLFVWGIHWWQRWWLIVDTPTSEAAHVFIGFNEVTGHVKAIGPSFVSPVNGERCVWWSYKLERYESNGKSSSWLTKESGNRVTPFLVEDASGSVRIVPDGLHVTSPYRNTASEREIGDMLTIDALRNAATVHHREYHEGFVASILGIEHTSGAIASLPGKWRVVEEGLREGDQVFVQGQGRLRADQTVGVELAQPVQVRVGTERAASQTAQVLAMVGVIVGSGALVMAPGVAARHPTSWMGVVGAGVVLVLFLSYLVRVHNRLVRVREQAERAWSMIAVAMERRAALIPELTAVAQAAFAHEQGLQELLAEARSTLPSRALPDAAAVNTAHGAAQAGARLVALAEASPTLSANAPAAQLFAELGHTEDSVAFARHYYNEALEILRNRAQSFPDRLVVPWVGIPNLELFSD